ncbi:hypothetical protein NE398_05350 [Clostridium tertium]|uniref:Uncharacterized protein n=1 Tax=Clostridium tertium TaxID=1559 RepID=A0A9X3XJR0_9CLOT|nr:hypothetical protein [Clostridium tertium]MDC4239591.1 hypothetical protein [Clostridium tertium]
MKNKEKILLGLTCFLGGVVAGFIIAPIKQGVYLGNNCGNTVKNDEELENIVDNNIEENEGL